MNVRQVLAAHGVGVGKRLTGDALPAHVLNGKKFMNANGEGTGTMADLGALNITPGAAAINIASGFTSGGTVAGVANLTAARVKAGETVGGVLGTFGNGMTAVAADILSGKTAIVGPNTVTGTMVSRPFQSAPASLAANEGNLYVRILPGAYVTTQDRDGVQIAEIPVSDPDFIAANIRSGINVFGLIGSLIQGKRTATGTVSGVRTFTVTGIAFRPRVVVVRETSSSTMLGAVNDSAGLNMSNSTGSVSNPITITADGFSLGDIGNGLNWSWQVFE